jgi:acyl carrier protein
MGAQLSVLGRVDGEPSPGDAKVATTRASITKIICDTLQISPATLAATQNLRQLENVDSINLVRVMARIEDHFDIELEDDFVFEVTTLDELVAAVGRLASGRTAR